MTVALEAFHVLTEFRFDAGHAILTSEKLQGAVDGVSQAAQRAEASFMRLGMGIVGYLGLGTGSVLGLLQASIAASDKFGQSQRQLANIFLSNNMFKGANGFEEAMTNSAAVMENIRKKAQEFALPAGEMVQFTKLIGATLISHGLDDTSLKKSTDISRGFLKSAPTLGIDPQLAQGQLLDAVLGRANLGDTLFQRLMNETSAMKQFKGNPKGFNALPDAKRVQTLTNALMQFGSNTKILEGNARSLSGEIQRLKDSFVGMFSLLKPIGDALLRFILPSFHALNNFLQKEGKKIGEHLGDLMKSLLDNPRQAMIAVLQAKSLGGDFKLAKNFTLIGVAIMGIVEILKFFGLSLGQFSGVLGVARATVGYLISGMGVLMGWLGRFLIWITGAGGIFGALWTILNGVVIAASTVLVPFTLLLLLFQLISRAVAIAKVDSMIEITKAMPRFTEALVSLKNAFSVLAEPFIRIFNATAQAISPLFKFSLMFEGLIWIINRVADAITLFLAGFQGVVFVIMHLYERLLGMVTGNATTFGSVGEAFNAGVDGMIEDIQGKVASGEGGVANTVTNIGSVVIENNFKEQMEPDRIAFTLKEQLMKTAQNPTQSTNRSFSGAMSR